MLFRSDPGHDLLEKLQKVMARILDSYYEHPRSILLFFYYPSDSYLDVYKRQGYLRQDGKTPWSFTPVWHWSPVLHAQARWEAEKQQCQLLRSRCWDTTLALLGF